VAIQQASSAADMVLSQELPDIGFSTGGGGWYLEFVDATDN